MLAHRLGLVPLKIDPALLELKTQEEVGGVAGLVLVGCTGPDIYYAKRENSGP